MNELRTMAKWRKKRLPRESGGLLHVASDSGTQAGACVELQGPGTLA